MQALSIRNLVKVYDNGIQALNGIELDVAEGEFFALLGPNGAGKTTAIGIITSLVNKTSGEVRIYSAIASIRIRRLLKRAWEWFRRKST